MIIMTNFYLPICIIARVLSLFSVFLLFALGSVLRNTFSRATLLNTLPSAQRVYKIIHDKVSVDHIRQYYSCIPVTCEYQERHACVMNIDSVYMRMVQNQMCPFSWPLLCSWGGRRRYQRKWSRQTCVVQTTADNVYFSRRLSKSW